MCILQKKLLLILLVESSQVSSNITLIHNDVFFKLSGFVHELLMILWIAMNDWLNQTWIYSTHVDIIVLHDSWYDIRICVNMIAIVFDGIILWTLSQLPHTRLELLYKLPTFSCLLPQSNVNQVQRYIINPCLNYFHGALVRFIYTYQIPF